MSEWIRMDTDWPEHRRLEGATAGEVAFWIACLAYCGRNETDGDISSRSIKLVRFWSKVRVDRLIEMGLLQQRKDGGYSLRDYLDHQESKAALEAKREVWRQRAAARRHASSPPRTPEPRPGWSPLRTQQDPIPNPTVVEGPGLEGGSKNGKAWPADSLPFPMRERWVSDRVLHTFVDADIPTLIAAWQNSNDLRDSGQAIEQARDPRRYALAIAGRVA